MRLFKKGQVAPWGITIYRAYRYLFPERGEDSLRLYLAYTTKVTWVTTVGYEDGDEAI